MVRSPWKQSGWSPVGSFPTPPYCRHRSRCPLRHIAPGANRQRGWSSKDNCVVVDRSVSWLSLPVSRLPFRRTTDGRIKLLSAADNERIVRVTAIARERHMSAHASSCLFSCSITADLPGVLLVAVRRPSRCWRLCARHGTCSVSLYSSVTSHVTWQHEYSWQCLTQLQHQMRNVKAKCTVYSHYDRDLLHKKGCNKMRCGICLSVRLSVCLLRASTYSNSRTERPRKLKIGRMETITPVIR